MLDGKCLNPKNPKPHVTTMFCVYMKGHGGNCSWADPADVRRAKLSLLAANSQERPA